MRVRTAHALHGSVDTGTNPPKTIKEVATASGAVQQSELARHQDRAFRASVGATWGGVLLDVCGSDEAETPRRESIISASSASADVNLQCTRCEACCNIQARHGTRTGLLY
jgi:hypothetical protein